MDELVKQRIHEALTPQSNEIQDLRTIQTQQASRNKTQEDEIDKLRGDVQSLRKAQDSSAEQISHLQEQLKQFQESTAARDEQIATDYIKKSDLLQAQDRVKKTIRASLGGDAVENAGRQTSDLKNNEETPQTVVWPTPALETTTPMFIQQLRGGPVLRTPRATGEVEAGEEGKELRGLTVT